MEYKDGKPYVLWEKIILENKNIKNAIILVRENKKFIILQMKKKYMILLIKKLIGEKEEGAY